MFGTFQYLLTNNIHLFVLFDLSELVAIIHCFLCNSKQFVSVRLIPLMVLHPLHIKSMHFGGKHSIYLLSSKTFTVTM